jgi:hypothetical protein
VHPLIKAATQPPAVVAIGLGIVGVVFGWTLLGSIAVIIGGVLATLRANSVEAMILHALNGMSVVLDDSVRNRLAQLGPSLKAARNTTGAEQLGMQAYEQLTALCNSFLTYRKVLSRRFNTGELTHGRYLKAGEQVFLAAMDDLDNTTTQLQGLATVDIDQIRAQLRILERKEAPTDNETRERDTLRERMQVRTTAEDNVRGLLASNEQALTQLSAAHASLATIRTERGLAELEANSAMQQLEELSKRAGRYAIDAPPE